MPATREELIGLFEHLERELDAAEFLYPPDKDETMVRNIRAMILRARSHRPGSAHHPRHDRGAGAEQISGQSTVKVTWLWTRFLIVGLLRGRRWSAIAFAVAARRGAPSRVRRPRRCWRGAIALFMLGVGGGTYWMLGQPDLALRTPQGIEHPRLNGADRASDRARARGAGRSAGLGLSGARLIWPRAIPATPPRPMPVR